MSGNRRARQRPTPRRRTGTFAAATLMNAASTLGLQALAVIILPPAVFGLYSLPYLVGAFATLIVLAVVTDVSARRSSNADLPGEWAPYSSMTLLLSFAAGVLAMLVALAAPDLEGLAAAAFIAVATQTYRVAERFHEVRAGHLPRVIRADAAGLVAVPIAWFGLAFVGMDGIHRIMWIWAISSAAQILFVRFPAPFHWFHIRQWLVHNKKDIRTLLGDTLIISTGTFGTPLVLAPVLGLASLGIYRSINNLTGPITLLIGPLRPKLAQYQPRDYYRRRLVIPLAVVAVVAGLVTAAGIVVLTTLVVSRTSTLASLRPYAVQGAISVAATLIAAVYCVVARFFAERRALLLARTIQSLSALAFPLLGSLVDLDAVIDGFAAAAVASAVTWVYAARRIPGHEVRVSELITTESRGVLVDEV